MSKLDNEDGSPKLEKFDELTLGFYNNSRAARQILWGIDYKEDWLLSDRSRADRGANIRDMYEMVDHLLPSFQMHHCVSSKNEWLVIFPYMYIDPVAGDNIYNETTGETYSVAYVAKDLNGEFNGSCLLSGTTAPEETDVLRYIDASGAGTALRKYINFFHAYPTVSKLDISASDSDIGTNESEPFTPTIVAQLFSQLPGTVAGKKDAKTRNKELKPRVREEYHYKDDPRNYTVQVRGQWFDNIVKFKCFETSHLKAERLVDWFMEFMNKHTWVIRKNGIQQIFFEERKGDVVETVWRDDIVGYEVCYYVRTEELTTDLIHNTASVDLSVELSDRDRRIAEEVSADPTGGLVTGPFGDRFSTLFDATHDDEGNYLYGNTDTKDGRLNE